MFTTPTLLLDEAKCKANIQRMAEKAQKHHIGFRPHFKTHQSLDVGQWFKQAGVTQITVSSFEMAHYFSSQWKDITVAFPVNVLEIDRINALAKRIKLNVLVESLESVDFLKTHLDAEIGFFIKIDVGYHRTGVQPDDTDLLDTILQAADGADRLRFCGFLGHAGHAYKCTHRDDVMAIHKQSQQIMIALKKRYNERYPGLAISLGDTPTCSLADDFTGIDEIRPGNFALYDLMQHQIGSCEIENIAVAMRCPIVALHPERRDMVIYGGGVHFSKEQLKTLQDTVVFGRVVESLDSGGWGDVVKDMYVKNLSQEHGIVTGPTVELQKYKVGDRITVLPVHACLTADLMKRYVLTGDLEAIFMMGSKHQCL